MICYKVVYYVFHYESLRVSSLFIDKHMCYKFEVFEIEKFFFVSWVRNRDLRDSVISTVQNLRQSES